MRMPSALLTASAACVVVATIGAAAPPSHLARFGRTGSGLVVTTSADLASPCPASMISLRCAIDQANADGSGDAISFAIPRSDKGCRRRTIEGARVKVCTVESDLNYPGIVLAANATTIDGYTQAGAVTNTNSIGSGQGDNAILTVALDGSLLRSGHDGIVLAGSGDTLRGVVITGYPANAGIRIGGAGTTVSGCFVGIGADGERRRPNGTGIVVVAKNATIGGSSPADTNVIGGNGGAGIALERRSGNSVILGNLIGTDRTGVRADGNGTGVSIDASNGNTIGGGSAAARNVLSANTSSGLAISGSARTTVQGNFIGIDVTGLAALGNGRDGSPGVSLLTKSTSDQQNVIGGTILGTINVISGNHSDGVALTSGTTQLVAGNAVIGNAIGSDPDGKAGLPNGGNGVFIEHGVNGATIGGAADGAHNLIGFNGKAGVLVGASPSDSGVHVAISQNTIFSNGGFGIDLSPQGTVNCSTPPPGPNDYVPCPVIANATTSMASGTACAHCIVEVYLGTSDAGDLGHGEGLEILGTATANASGQWTAQFLLGKPRSGSPISATATAVATTSTGAETSEFAANVIASVQARKLLPRSVHTTH